MPTRPLTRHSGDRRPRSDEPESPMSGSREWDATTYDRVSGPQVEWARGVIERLGLRGDEVVLDAGCGSGRVTAMLLADLSEDGSVIAADGSEAMVEAASERLAGTRTRFLHSDLLDLDLHEEVDAVFSNAVFHWIADHARLFGVSSRGPAARRPLRGPVRRRRQRRALLRRRRGGVRARALPRARGRVRPDQLRRSRGRRSG